MVEDGNLKLQTLNLSEVQALMKDYDKRQIQLISVKKQATSSNGAPNLKKEILVKIPGMIKSFRVIDFPGISSNWAYEALTSMIVSEMALLFYVKNMTHPEIMTQNIYKLFSFVEKFNSENPIPMLVSCIFTFKDRFLLPQNLEQEDNINESKKKKIERLNAIFKELQNISAGSNVSIDQIYFLNTYFMRNEGKYPDQAKKEMNIFFRCIQEINNSISIYKDKIKPVYYYKSLLHLITDSYNKFLKEKKTMSEQGLNLLLDYIEKSKISINVTLKEFLENIENPNEFKLYHPELFKKVEIIIMDHIKMEKEENERKKIIVPIYFFIKSIMALSLNEITEALVEKIQKILESEVKEFLLNIKKCVIDDNFLNTFNLYPIFQLSPKAPEFSLGMALAMTAMTIVFFPALIFMTKQLAIQNEHIFNYILFGFCESIKKEKNKILQNLTTEIEKMFDNSIKKVIECKEIENRTSFLKQKINAEMEDSKKDPDFEFFNKKANKVRDICSIEEIFPDEEWKELMKEK